jgi:hypothetical protein
MIVSNGSSGLEVNDDCRKRMKRRVASIELTVMETM